MQLRTNNFLNYSYSELLAVHSEISKSDLDAKLELALISNITINQIKEPLECLLGLHGLRGDLTIGDYDNIVQDSDKVKESDVVVIFWEVWNLIPDGHFSLEDYDNDKLEELVSRTENEIKLVLNNLSKTSLVIFNEFNAALFTRSNKSDSKIDYVVSRLNMVLDEVKAKNVFRVDLKNVFMNQGIDNSVDWRFYYSSKAPYTFSFFKGYCNEIISPLLALSGKSKKALIFDCDNTLWKGVLGEDGFEGIDMSPGSTHGKIFHEVQRVARRLARNGVLIGLCSKNNPEDTLNVIQNHNDQILKEGDIVINKSNWQDKVTNLREIASELNIGLDSLVFVDDSPFEVEFVREQLPQVSVFQVPSKINLYPNLIRSEIEPLFFNFSLTSEDMRKAEMYKEQRRREEDRLAFSSIEDYLSSLGLVITVKLNDHSQIGRLAQMTQKTNQFNLRTVRYTEQDIANFSESKMYDVISIAVSDKFGDSGITGLCIMKYDQGEAFIDTFLLSCRVIGRNIEYKIAGFLKEHLSQSDVQSLTSEYLRTPKNEQTREFYDRCFFELIDQSEDSRNYRVDINQWGIGDIDYIQLHQE